MRILSITTLSAKACRVSCTWAPLSDSLTGSILCTRHRPRNASTSVKVAANVCSKTGSAGPGPGGNTRSQPAKPKRSTTGITIAGTRRSSVNHSMTACRAYLTSSDFDSLDQIDAGSGGVARLTILDRGLGAKVEESDRVGGRDPLKDRKASRAI